MKRFDELKIGDHFQLNGGELIWVKVVGDYYYNAHKLEAGDQTYLGLIHNDSLVTHITPELKVYVVFGNRGGDNHYDMIKATKDKNVAISYTNDRNKAANTDPKYYSFHYEEIEVE